MENEKDRSGEKFVERANEDFYFAAKDRELIEEMRARLQKVEALARTGHARTCPKCSGKLESYRFMESGVDRCKSCEGTWLDKGELDRIVRKAARGPLATFLEGLLPKMKHE